MKEFLKKLTHLIVLFLLIGVFILLIYHITEKPTPQETASYHRISREIENPAKLWLNGYLGHFFRFRVMGNLNWIMIPIILHFILTLRRRENWEKALAFAYICTVLLLCIQGYHNFRYQITLLPFTLAVVLLYTGNLWNGSLSAQFPAFLLRFTILNKPLKIFIKWRSSISVFALCVGVFLTILVLFNLFRNVRYIRSPLIAYKYFPYRILAHIERFNINDEERLLICNEPMVYYYTDKKGIYYTEFANKKEKGLVFTCYTEKGFDFTLSMANKLEVLDILRNKMKVKYIIISSSMEMLDKDIRFLTANCCELLFSDFGYNLYELKSYRANWLDTSYRPTIVGNSAFFPPPHDASAFLHFDEVSDNYSAAQHNSPYPHWIEIDLGETRSIGTIEIRWYSKELCAVSFSISGRNSLQSKWESMIIMIDNQEETLAKPLAIPANFRYIRLEVDKAAGQERLLLRSMKLLEP